MSFSIQPPNMNIRDNAAFEGKRSAADFTEEENTMLPLPPVSINLSLFPKLHWSKESRIPRLTFTTSLVPERPSKKPHLSEADDDDDIEAEMEEIVDEIRRLSAKLVVLRNRKANKDSRAAAATGCENKGTNLAVNPAMACCRKQGSGKPPKPPTVKVSSEGRKGAAADCTKKPGKREDATTGSLKPRNLLHERQNLVTSKRPAMSDIMEAVASPCKQPRLEPKRARRKWSLPPENYKKGFPFYFAGSSGDRTE